MLTSKLVSIVPASKEICCAIVFCNECSLFKRLPFYKAFVGDTNTKHEPGEMDVPSRLTMSRHDNDNEFRRCPLKCFSVNSVQNARVRMITNNCSYNE